MSGLGSEVFHRSVLATGGIHRAFKAVNPQLKFAGWQPRQSHGHMVLTFSNRYFTPDTDNGHEVRTFPNDHDPLHVLRKAVPSGVYTADNEVLYFDRRSTTGERCAIDEVTLILYFNSHNLQTALTPTCLSYPRPSRWETWWRYSAASMPGRSRRTCTPCTSS